MVDQLRTMSFEFGGTAEVKRTVKPRRGREGQDEIVNLTGEAQEQIEMLNGKNDDFAKRIERELQRLLPPEVTAQASIQFQEGSLLVSGAITLISWAGPIVLAAVKEEGERQLANLVRGAVQRVMGYIFASENLYRLFAPVTMTVRAHSGGAGSIVGEAASEPNLQPEGSQRGVVNGWVRDGRALVALLSATLLLLATQVILLADRFVTVQWKP